MILTDGTHLVSDKSVEELHDFAKRIKLKREWFQDKRVPHYDLFGNKVKRAEMAGAKRVSAMELVRKLIEGGIINGRA